MVMDTLENMKGGLRHGLAHSPGSVTACSRHGCSFQGVFLPSLHPRYAPRVACRFSQCSRNCSNGALLRLFSRGGTLLRLLSILLSIPSVHLFLNRKIFTRLHVANREIFFGTAGSMEIERSASSAYPL